MSNRITWNLIALTDDPWSFIQKTYSDRAFKPENAGNDKHADLEVLTAMLGFCHARKVKT